MRTTTYVIAEAGVNHNGSLDKARRLIDVAAAAGADAVKFQTFKAGKLVSRQAAKADYQQRSTDATESQFDMIRKLELSDDDHFALQSHCVTAGIEFLSTPFDLDSLDFLVRQMALPRLKLPSGEITNAPFLLAVALTAKPVILSTGMSTLEEVGQALGVLAFGYLQSGEAPNPAAFAHARESAAGQALLRDKVRLLHCTTEYPAPFAEVNLRAMDTLGTAFGLPVGYSDHTQGIAVSIAAVARGARIIEKHFTLDRALPGPDHAASLEPGELKAMIEAIRQVELALGSAEKGPATSELKNLAVARKSLVAAVPICKGESFTTANVAIKRPGNGINPFRYWEYLGRIASRDYAEDEGIEP